MTSRMVVYRTCDRPHYTAETWPRLVEATNPETWIVAVENSADPESIERNLRTVYGAARDRVLVHMAGKPLGLNQPIFTALDAYETHHGEPPGYVLVTDDDILMPDGWDDECVRMIESGAWDVTGIARWERVKGKPVSGEGERAGYAHPFMSGGGCCFPYRLLADGRIDNGWSGLNAWSSRFRCAWSTRMVKREIDKYQDPDWSMSR